MITGAPFNWTYVDESNRLLNIEAGALDTGALVCIRYDLTVDTFLCSPAIYMVGTHQVVEVCDDGMGCVCETVKACEKILFRSDPNNTGCDCDIRQGLVDMYRQTTGYTDATLATKIAPENVDAADKNRYLPGDTMIYKSYYRFNSQEAMDNAYQLLMGFRLRNTSSVNQNTIPTLELNIDMSKSEILEFAVHKADGTTTMVNFADIPSCLDPDPSVIRVTGVDTYFGKSPWDGLTEVNFRSFTGNTNHGNDFLDNSRPYLAIRNHTALQECRENFPTNWEANGNCLSDFFLEYGIVEGDSLYLTVALPLIKNPQFPTEGDPIPDDPMVYPEISLQKIDEFDSDCIITAISCREFVPFETFCPGEITAVSNITLDDCGGTASHTFSVDRPTPVGWYVNEYRPYMPLTDIEIPIFSPLIFCGNSKGTSLGGVEYDLTVQSTINQECATVGGQVYCTDTSGIFGTTILNPQSDGFPGMGVGLNGLSDQFTIQYDFCMVCPADLTTLSSYELKYNYRYPYDPPSSSQYRCGFNANTGANNELDSCLNIGNNVSYYDYFDFDGEVFKSENSFDLTLTDVRNGFPALTQTVEKTIISSGSPNISEEINCITIKACLLYTSPSPRDATLSRMPSSA